MRNLQKSRERQEEYDKRTAAGRFERELPVFIGNCTALAIMAYLVFG